MIYKLHTFLWNLFWRYFCRPPVAFKKLHPDAMLPEYAHGGVRGDSGMDLFFLGHGDDLSSFQLMPGERYLARTGLAIQMPLGCEGQVRSKSGRAIKEGLFVLNSPGTVDSSYTGEIKVILQAQDKPVSLVKGQKIAQLVICPYLHLPIVEVDFLEETKRAAGGFGSTKI
jgi:dUTP pyrophosphatase